ncbi:hypothetical protein [Pseudomonas sp. LB3P31]
MCARFLGWAVQIYNAAEALPNLIPLSLWRLNGLGIIPTCWFTIP